jgi:hypothetical protein
VRVYQLGGGSVSIIEKMKAFLIPEALLLPVARVMISKISLILVVIGWDPRKKLIGGLTSGQSSP